jgi:methyl-accepting chemotaxis protein
VVAEDINLNIHRITHLMDSTASHTTELNTESNLLNQAAQQLKTITGQFKLH